MEANDKLLQQLIFSQRERDFLEYPALATSEKDTYSIINYYINLKKQAIEININAFKFINHMQTKTPEAHRIYFIDFLHTYNIKNVLDWDAFDTGVSYIQKTYKTPSLIEELNIFYDQVSEIKNSEKVKLLINKIQNYANSYPNRNTNIKTLINWLQNRFPQTTKRMLDHSPQIYALITNTNSNALEINLNTNETWKQIKEFLFEYSVYEDPYTYEKNFYYQQNKNKYYNNIGRQSYQRPNSKTYNEIDELTEQLEKLKIQKAKLLSSPNISQTRGETITTPGRICFFCGKKGHFLNDCTVLANYKNENLLCKINNKICLTNGIPVSMSSYKVFVDNPEYSNLHEKLAAKQFSVNKINNVKSNKLSPEEIALIGDTLMTNSIKHYLNDKPSDKEAKKVKYSENLNKLINDMKSPEKEEEWDTIDPIPKAKRQSLIKLSDREEDILIDEILNTNIQISLKKILGLNQKILNKLLNKIKIKNLTTFGPKNAKLSEEHTVINKISNNQDENESQDYSSKLAQSLNQREVKIKENDLAGSSWKHGPLIYINGHINNKFLVNMLLDTGSVISTIHPKLAKELNLKTSETNKKVSGFNSTESILTAISTTTIRINNTTYGIKLYHNPYSSKKDIIIGQNFLFPNLLSITPTINTDIPTDSFIRIILRIPNSDLENSFKVPLYINTTEFVTENSDLPVYKICSNNSTSMASFNINNLLYYNDQFKINNINNITFTKEEENKIIECMNNSILIPAEKEYFLNKIKTNNLRSVLYFEGDKTRIIQTTPTSCEFKEIPQPWNLKSYPVPKGVKLEAQELLNKLLQDNKIKDSTSAYNNPIFFQKKKNGSLRLLADLRKLNEMTIKESSVSTTTDELAEELTNSPIFSIIDLKGAYEQVPINENISKRTAFWSSIGKLEFATLPQGFINSPTLFERIVLKTIRKFIKYTLVFMDDIAIRDDTYKTVLDLGWEDNMRKVVKLHLDTVINILVALNSKGFQISIEKLQVGITNGKFLGFEIKNKKRYPTIDKQMKIKNFPVPKTKKDVRKFLGICNYFRAFVNGYAILCSPLYDILHKSVDIKSWDKNHLLAFEKIKQAFRDPPGLTKINPELILVLFTDASLVGYGATLFNIDIKQSEFLKSSTPLSFTNISKAKKYLIKYESGKFSENEMHYNIYEKELYAVYLSLKKFASYISNNKIYIGTDNSAVSFVLKKNLACIPLSRISNWISYIIQFDFQILKIPGDKNFSDILSRLEEKDTIEQINNERISSNLIKLYTNQTVLKEELENDYDILIGSNPNITKLFKLESQNDEENKQLITDLQQNINKHMDYINNIKKSLTERFILYYKDFKYSNIIEFLSNLEIPKDILPNQEMLFKKICLQFFIHKGKLFRKNTFIPRIVVTNPFIIFLILHHYHDELGHIGINTSIKKISDNFYIPKLHLIINYHIKTCVNCQFYSPLGRQLTPINSQVITTIMTHIAIDTVFMPTTDEYKYLVIGRCMMTAYVEAIKLKTLSAKSVAQFIHTEFICRYGMIKVLQTDGGIEFTAEIIRELCQKFNIKHRITAAYHPKSNGFIEGSHKRLVNVLLKLPGKWTENLSSALYADRWITKKSTGMKPGFLLYGFESSSSFESIFNTWFEICDKKISTEELLLYRAKQFQLKDIKTDEAISNMEMSRETSKQYYEKINKTKESTLQIGDIVLVYDAIRKSRKEKKRFPYWNGPYKIKNKLSNVFVLEELDGTILKRHYTSDMLKLFKVRKGTSPGEYFFGGGRSVGYYSPTDIRKYDGLFTSQKE